MERKWQFNQQVAACIHYQIIPGATWRALKASPVFNAVAVCPAKIMKKRQWFAFDRDARAEEKIRTLISDPREIAALMKETGGGAALEQFDVSPEAIKALLAGATGAIRLRFAEGAKQDHIAQKIAQEIPFPKLANLLTRFSQALTREGRGALLQIDISHAPALNY